MKKSFMNIKNFVDSNVRQYRIDRASSNCNSGVNLGEEFQIVEKQFDHLRQVCTEAEKRISALLPTLQSSSLSSYYQNAQAGLNNLSSLATTTISTSSSDPSSISAETQSNSTLVISPDLVNHLEGSDIPARGKNKKLPTVGLYKFLSKYCDRLKPDSLMCSTLSHCSTLQNQVNSLQLTYDYTVEQKCLKPLQQILEVDVPNVIKLKKNFLKTHADLESAKSRFNVANQKQQQLAKAASTNSYNPTHNVSNQTNINKLDQLKKELDDAVSKYEQSKDTYAIELYAFVSREPEFVALFMKFYESQAEFSNKVATIISCSLPTLNSLLVNTPRKAAFGTRLEEHIKCTGHSVSAVITVSVHFLYHHALNEEGLFRISGSSTKVKKLKNAINAWYITLAKQSEFVSLSSQANNNQQSDTQCNNSCVLAIQDLFKDILGQQISPIVASEPTYNRNLDPPSDTLYDVHSIAGLLKLYLRDLPDPLLCHSLYKDWIEAACKPIVDNQRSNALRNVIQKLPKANYNNLRHLIRFLNLLTHYCETNKMTSTNLAIAMAPSLIWAPATDQTANQAQSSPFDQPQPHSADMQTSLGLQISSAGMSASLHTLIVDSLISQADLFMPEPVDYTVDVLDSEQGRSRNLKTSSPSGLSTASSNSFVSSSNCSTDNSPQPSIKYTKSKSGDSVNIEPCSSSASPSFKREEVERKSSTSLNKAPPKAPMRQSLCPGGRKPPPLPPPPPSNNSSLISCRNSNSSSHSQLPRVDSSSEEAVDEKESLDMENNERKSSILYRQSTVINGHKIGREALESTGDTKTDPQRSHSSISAESSTSAVQKQTLAHNSAIRPRVPPPSRPQQKQTSSESSGNKQSQSLVIDLEKDPQSSPQPTPAPRPPK